MAGPAGDDAAESDFREADIVRSAATVHRVSALRLLSVFAAALLVKTAVLYALYDHPLLQPRGDMDTAAYVALAAQSVAKPYFLSPLYLFFLRAVGVNLLAARIVQIILGSIAVVLIHDSARRWFGERAAMVSAALAILTGVFSFYEVTILQAALDPFLVALTLWTLQRGWFAATGFALGLFVLNRPNAVLWVPVLLLGIAWVRGWRSALVLLIAFIIPIAPVAVRNYIVAHEVVLISSHGGLNFYIGNNPEADGTYHHVPGIRPTIAGQVEDAPPSEVMYRRAWDWIRTNPAAALRLFLRKIAYTFNQTDLALNYSYSYFVRDVRSPLRYLIVGPWLLFPLGLLGAFRDRRLALWATFIPMYAVSVALFFVSSRYRLPLLVPMCITAGAFWPSPASWRGIYSWLAAAVIAIAVCWNFGLDDGRAHARTNMIVYLIEQQRFQDADRLIADTQRITRDPATLHARSAAAYRQSGVAFVQSSQPEKAMAAFKSAHRLDPADASDLLNIAVLHAQRGEIEAAREKATAALRLRPGYPQAEGLLEALEVP